MSLSGADKLEARLAITNGLSTSFPNTATHYDVCTDTFGGLYTACANGLFIYLFIYFYFL